MDVLKEVKPSVFFTTPHVWRKIYSRISSSQNGLRRAGSRKLIALGQACKIGGPLPRTGGFMYKMATGLNVQIGLEKVRYCGTGGGSLMAEELVDQLQGIGLTVHEICGVLMRFHHPSHSLGVTEATGIIAIPAADKWSKGTCGPSLNGLTVRLEEEEILCSGPNVFVQNHSIIM